MSDDTTWFVLLHTPGPAVPVGQTVFDQPGIGEHYAFLKRRLEGGQLIAAGPLQDVDGAGMTILAVGSLEEAERLARVDDQAVVSGLLTVQVRPWQVVMSTI